MQGSTGSWRDHGLYSSGTDQGNAYLDIVIRTGLGHARNVLVVLTADVVITVGGGYGTLSEIAIGLKTGRTIYGISTWEIEGIVTCNTPEEAVLTALHGVCRSSEYRSTHGG
jgi:uncharacterized protein (TIGR00725 family)